MGLTKTELDELKVRVSKAHYRGYKVANPQEYVQLLGGGDPPEDTEPLSTGHILHLIENYGKVPDKLTPVTMAVLTESTLTEVVPAVPEEDAPVMEATVEEVPVEEPATVDAAPKAESKKKAKKKS